MCIYYCDNCGHIFNTPSNILGYLTCPKCSSKDFELLNNKNNDKSTTNNPAPKLADNSNSSLFAFSTLGSRFHFPK